MRSNTLSDVDLLATLICDPSDEEGADATRLMAHIGGLPGLIHLPSEQIQAIPALSDAAKDRLIALAEWTRRAQRPSIFSSTIINTAADAARLLQGMPHLRQEHVCLILLDTHKQVLAIPTIYIGTVNMSILRTAEIFREVLAHNAPAFLLAHNHPSGQPQPSPQDVQLTRTLIDASRLLDVQFIDHLIIGRLGWASLKEMGLGFS